MQAKVDATENKLPPPASLAHVASLRSEVPRAKLLTPNPFEIAILNQQDTAQMAPFACILEVAKPPLAVLTGDLRHIPDKEWLRIEGIHAPRLAFR